MLPVTVNSREKFVLQNDKLKKVHLENVRSNNVGNLYFWNLIHQFGNITLLSFAQKEYYVLPNAYKTK